jgi:hypothetical protein
MASRKKGHHKARKAPKAPKARKHTKRHVKHHATSSVKTELGHVIKTLQHIKKAA